MPKRKVLKGIAHDTLASFVSRNNHVGGYWAIGKLYKLIKSSDCDKILIDLKLGTIYPDQKEFHEMVLRNSEKLRQQLVLKNVPDDFFLKAEIEFKVDKEKTRRHQLFPGQKFKQYTCGLVLEDHSENEYCELTKGWCFPHHPNMEQKSEEEE